MQNLKTLNNKTNFCIKIDIERQTYYFMSIYQEDYIYVVSPMIKYSNNCFWKTKYKYSNVHNFYGHGSSIGLFKCHKDI